MKSVVIPILYLLLSLVHGDKLKKCLDLKPAHIHKQFKAEFFKHEIFFPLGQSLDYGSETIVPPHTVKFPEENRCFALTLFVNQAEGSGEVELPFNCNRDKDELCCKLETKGTGLENDFGLWGYARVTKTDNKSYMLVVTCVSHKKPSWVLLYNEPKVDADLRDEILDYIEELGFSRDELSTRKDPVSLVKIRRDTC